MFEDIFDKKTVLPDKLISYGFVKEQSKYQYKTEILGGEFSLEIEIEDNVLPKTKLIELSVGEEYVLYKTDAVGSFVGLIRSAITEVLIDISEKCYQTTVFKESQTFKIIEYVGKKYGDAPEYLWEKFPSYAVFRRNDNKKWYAVLLTVSLRKLGLNSDEIVEIIDLRGEPIKVQELLDGNTYFKGWHMNKKYWYTIVLDGTVSIDEICKKIDDSYVLVG